MSMWIQLVAIIGALHFTVVVVVSTKEIAKEVVCLPVYRLRLILLISKH